MLKGSFDIPYADNITENDIVKGFAVLCPQLKNQVNEAVCNLREKILNCDPLHLLRFAQVRMLLNRIGISSEFQQSDFESIAIDRFAEYVQSVYVSGSLHVTVQTDNEEDEFNSILNDYINLFKHIHQYYISLASE